MALQKSIVSERTGATLTYHEISQVCFSETKASIVVTSFVDKAAKDSGKRAAETASITVDYADTVLPKPIVRWAQDQLIALDAYAGAEVV